MHILDGTFPPGSEAAVAQAFARAGARTPALARSLRELGVDGTPGATSLISRALLRKRGAGTMLYYLDVAHYQQRQRRRHAIGLAGAVAVGLVLAAAIYRAAG